ncbi:MAG: S8 family serine peptidase [Chloroflexi bacterium]|nr:S8 family serine peptidase [Chloroflexota bacterium]
MKQNLRLAKSVGVILTLALLILVLAASNSSVSANSGGINFGSTFINQATNLQDVPTNQIIIKYKATANLTNSRAPAGTTRLQELSNAAGVPLTYFREMSGQAHVLRLDTRMDTTQVREISNRLMTLSDVEYAEPDAIMQTTLTPNDPQYSNQWHYFETYGMNATAAWDITTGSNNTVISVVDTGILNHADLSGRTLPGYDMVSDTWMANDGGGRDADPSDPGDWIAANACYPGSPAQNSSWHGTHVAGTIGAASNNSAGVAGLNWVSKIVPVRVLGRCGGTLSDIADGMSWAAGLPVGGIPNNANPAKVINVSIGGGGLCSATYQNAINNIVAAGTTVIVAAGNNNANASGYQPANCTGIITVAATNRSGNRAWYSNYGSSVEISAPGGETTITTNGVLSTLNTGTTSPVNDSYAYYQGTSMATPHVVGVASLLLSLAPTLTPTQVGQILQNTVSAFPGGSTCNTSICGTGMLNAGAAVGAVHRINSFSPSSIAAGGGSFTLIVYGANFPSGATVLWNGSPRSTSWISSGELHATILGSDINLPTTGQVSVVGTHATYGSITTATRAYSVTGVANNLYLPLILKTDAAVLPGVPTLNAISNPSNSNAYNVTWTTSSNASTYILQESFNNAGFASPTEVYNGASTTWPASGKAAGTYYYRVKGHNATGDSGWSGTQSTTVNPTPTGIYGHVTDTGTNAAGVSLELRFWNGSAWLTQATTTTDANGNYSFTGVPSLSGGQQYYVRYSNSSTSSRLSGWWTQSLTSYTAGTNVAIGDFDLANIPLSSPGSGSTVTLPYTFYWTRRTATTSDSYEYNLFDPADSNPWAYTSPLGYVNNYTVNSRPSGFYTGVTYGWLVGVYSLDGGYGQSYYYRTIIFAAGSPAPIDLPLLSTPQFNRDRLPLPSRE